jgi:CDP-glycerol glycerophosphotransferase (TagB/SpsB family)
MLPQLLSKYIKVKEQFQREKWGIYDDTPDLHRAIAASDAYYGDWSSLISLFAVLNKPSLIQSIDLAGRDEIDPPTYYVFEKEADDLSKWLDDFGSVEPTAPFAEISGYMYMDGSSGQEIYNYFKKTGILGVK